MMKVQFSCGHEGIVPKGIEDLFEDGELLPVACRECKPWLLARPLYWLARAVRRLIRRG